MLATGNAFSMELIDRQSMVEQKKESQVKKIPHLGRQCNDLFPIASSSSFPSPTAKLDRHAPFMRARVPIIQSIPAPLRI